MGDQKPEIISCNFCDSQLLALLVFPKNDSDSVLHKVTHFCDFANEWFLTRLNRNDELRALASVVTSTSSCPPDSRQVCRDCLAQIEIVMEGKQTLYEVEARVRKLQNELLVELDKLKNQVDQVFEKMMLVASRVGKKSSNNSTVGDERNWESDEALENLESDGDGNENYCRERNKKNSTSEAIKVDSVSTETKVKITQRSTIVRTRSSTAKRQQDPNASSDDDNDLFQTPLDIRSNGTKLGDKDGVHVPVTRYGGGSYLYTTRKRERKRRKKVYDPNDSDPEYTTEEEASDADALSDEDHDRKEKLDYQRHRLLKEKRFHCFKCDMTFATKKSLHRHQKTSTHLTGNVKMEKEKLHYCSKCNLTFATNRNLVRHQKRATHLEEKTETEKPIFNCLECGKSFPSEAQRNRHRENIHERAHYTIPCGMCGKKFSKEIQLQVHLANIHKQGDSSNLPKCSECGKVFSSQLTLENHGKTHLSRDQRDKKMCELCGKCMYPTSYSRHQAYDCPGKAGSNLKTLVCEQCGIPVKTKALLMRHIQVVHEVFDGVHKCDICGKSGFKNRFGLAAHRKLHTNKKQYVCGRCGGNFKRIGHLYRHETTCDGRMRRKQHSNVIQPPVETQTVTEDTGVSDSVTTSN